MIELNKWFFVQLVNFLFLMVILNILVFRPLLDLFQKRKEATEGALEEAKRLNEEKDRVIAEYQKELAAARDKAREIYNSLREEGLKKQKELIEAAHEEAMKEIERAQQQIKEETEKARKELGEAVRRFSEEIVKKLVEV